VSSSTVICHPDVIRRYLWRPAVVTAPTTHDRRTPRSANVCFLPALTPQAAVDAFGSRVSASYRTLGNRVATAPFAHRPSTAADRSSLHKFDALIPVQAHEALTRAGGIFLHNRGIEEAATWCPPLQPAGLVSAGAPLLSSELTWPDIRPGIHPRLTFPVGTYIVVVSAGHECGRRGLRLARVN
jgi:hypothetical protein